MPKETLMRCAIQQVIQRSTQPPNRPPPHDTTRSDSKANSSNPPSPTGPLATHAVPSVEKTIPASMSIPVLWLLFRPKHFTTISQRMKGKNTPSMHGHSHPHAHAHATHPNLLWAKSYETNSPRLLRRLFHCQRLHTNHLHCRQKYNSY